VDIKFLWQQKVLHTSKIIKFLIQMIIYEIIMILLRLHFRESDQEAIRMVGYCSFIYAQIDFFCNN
jgi:hypothetical protein